MLSRILKSLLSLPFNNDTFSRFYRSKKGPLNLWLSVTVFLASFFRVVFNRGRVLRRRWLIATLVSQTLSSVAQSQIELPRDYWPVPREKSGVFFGSLASSAGTIHLAEARTEFNVDGRGVVIAIVGSGVNRSDDLARISGLSGFRATPDEHGLGTFLAELIGNQGLQLGIAPGVEIRSVKIVDQEGNWSVEQLAAALDELDRQAPETQVQVILLALSDGGHYEEFAQALNAHGDASAKIFSSVESLLTKGVIIVAPSGDRQLRAKTAGLTFPAIVPGVVVCPVVAEYSLHGEATEDGLRAEFSVEAGELLPTTQRPSVSPQFPVKNPTIASPGSVQFSIGTGSRQSRLRSSSMQSAAMVSAAVALLQQYHQSLTGEFASSKAMIEWMRRGGAQVSGRPTRLKGSEIEADALKGTFTQLDILRTLNIIRTDLVPTMESHTGVESSPNAIMGRTGGDLSEVADGINLKEAVSRFGGTESATGPEGITTLTGAGTCVAVLATGIRRAHPDFAERVVEAVDMTNSTPDDENGYGTFMAGVIGAGNRDRGLQGNFGMAPATKIVSVKVFPDSGSGSRETMQAGLAWVVENRKRLGISAVVLGGGAGLYRSWDQAAAEQPTAAVMRKLVQELRDHRVVVIAPAGNGTDGSLSGMNFPAIIPEVFSVAAMEFERGIQPQENVSDPVVQSDSIRSVSQIPATIAPYSLRLLNQTDIVAPGGPVISSGLDFKQGVALEGTSTAAALAAGTVLLVQGYYVAGHKELPPAEVVEECIRRGGWYIDEVKFNNGVEASEEYYRIDVLGALRQCYLRSMPQQKPQ